MLSDGLLVGDGPEVSRLGLVRPFRPLLLACLLAALGLALAEAPAQAASIQVTTTDDEFDTSGSGVGCSLREAIQSANTDTAFGGCTPGSGTDTITVPAGTYTLSIPPMDGTNADGDLDVLSNVTISGAGAAVTILDASLNTPMGSFIARALQIGNGATVSIGGLTIQNGDPFAPGGGIYNGGTLTLTGCIVRYNAASDIGGGIYNGGTLTLIDTDLTNNDSGGPPSRGGGIFNAGTLTLTRGTLSGNRAIDGGGIYNDVGAALTVTGSTLSNNATGLGDGAGIYNLGSPATVSGSTLRDNVAGGTGGGIFNDRTGVLTVADSALIGNTGSSRVGGIVNHGGGIFNGGTLNVTGGTLTGNHAFDGGGIANVIAALTVRDSTFNGNSAQLGGGIFVDASPDFTITNSTLSGNEAFAGGGIYFHASGPGTVANSTLSGNSADQGGGIAGEVGVVLNLRASILDTGPSGGNCAGPVASQGFNVADDATCFAANPANGDLVVGNVMLGPLASNGGPTMTHALLPGSPAIDWVTSGCPPPATDQRGVTRPQDGNGDTTAQCDSGAFELQGAAVPTLTIDDATVAEGNRGQVNAVFTVTLANPGNRTVTVSYATADDTATSPGDFHARSGTLTFAPGGPTTHSFAVPVNGDTTVEANERFFVTLSGATNASIGDGQGVGTINDDDAAPAPPAGGQFEFPSDKITVSGPGTTVEITVLNKSGHAGSVKFSITALTAILGVDFKVVSPPPPIDTLTFAEGEASKSIVIQVLSGPSLGEVQDDSEVMFALPWDGIAVEQTNPENVSFVISLVPASPGGTVGPISAITVTIVRPARAVAPPEDDTDKPRKETEEQRQQRERTNRGGKDDVYTEGNVTATSCDASPPAVTIANRDGPVTVRLLQEAAKACGSIRVGDYLEADGEKVHEQLFEATDVSVKHPRR